MTDIRIPETSLESVFRRLISENPNASRKHIEALLLAEVEMSPELTKEVLLFVFNELLREHADFFKFADGE